MTRGLSERFNEAFSMLVTPLKDHLFAPFLESLVLRASGSTTCPALVMGDRFIQLGNTWRLADIDGQHLVLQHSNGALKMRS